jgi:hypothetical protein
LIIFRPVFQRTIGELTNRKTPILSSFSLSHQTMNFNKRTKVNALLLASMPVVWEFWQLWKGYDDWNVSWFLALDYPMNIQWYMRDLGTELSKMLFSILVFRLARMNTPLRIIGRMIMFLGIFGVVMFFVNYNRFSHIIVYSGASILSMFISLFHEEYLEMWDSIKNKSGKLKNKIKNVFRLLSVTIPSVDSYEKAYCNDANTDVCT